MLWVLLGLVVVVSGSKWSCAPVSRVAVQAGVEYRAWNCTGAPASGEGSWAVGPLLFHVVSSDLTLRRPVPGVAPHGLATLPEFVPPTAAAAINGGFFWEINKKHFLDDVCFFKTRADALQPPSAAHPNYGLGDTLVIRDGVLLSSNCDLPGFNRPTAFIFNGTQSSLLIQHTGGQLNPAQFPNVLSCGPNLVSFRDGHAVYDVPTWDYGLNRWEHSANAAIGLLGRPGNSTTFVMVASDGHDGCPRSDPTCGVAAEPMAYFLKDFVGASQALQLDQGGSTTLWVKGLGVVNNMRNSLRAVFSGVFVL